MNKIVITIETSVKQEDMSLLSASLNAALSSVFVDYKQFPDWVVKIYDEGEQTIEEELTEKLGNSIVWGVADFEMMATQMEDPDSYDPKLYPVGLERMIHKHDASYGITWDSVEYYLDEYCKKTVE